MYANLYFVFLLNSMRYIFKEGLRGNFEVSCTEIGRHRCCFLASGIESRLRWTFRVGITFLEVLTCLLFHFTFKTCTNVGLSAYRSHSRRLFLGIKTA